MSNNQKLKSPIEDKNKSTKTFEYLFAPALEIFHSNALQDAFLRNTNGLKIINVFLGDTSLNKYKVDDGVFHILCDLSGPNAHLDLSAIRKSQFFLDIYVVNTDKKIMVILFQGFRGKSFKMFLDSRYGDMYKAEVLVPAIRKFKIATPVDKNHDGTPVIFRKAFRVLSNDKSLRQDLADKIGVCESSIKHLASKVNINEEVVNIKKYYENL